MNQPSWLRVGRTAVAVAAALVAAPVLAQNTTSGVNGVVTGADGKPVAGATVTIVHMESGSTSTVTTDASGRYAARGLRAGGPYTITVTQGGRTERRDGVVLNLAESFTYDAVIGAAAQTITVTGRVASDRFNRSNMGAGTTIGSRELETLASIQRNLQDYARTDPRISQTDKERGQITAGGQNIRYNSVTIDGVATNDTFGIEDNNLPTKKQPISIDAIQAVQINLSNFDVTQKGYTGANINAVTKSGTNDLRGSVYYVWRDDSLVGQRYNNQNATFSDAPAFEEWTRGFTLGGPILKDKLFFFASYEEFSSSKTSPDFGPAGSASPNVGISTTAISNASTTARTAWGIDAGSAEVPSGVALTVKDTLLKLDWNISDDHRANLRYTKTEQTEPFFPNVSATGLSLSSHFYNQIKSNESLVAQWFADWSPNFSTELKLSQREFAGRPEPVAGGRLPYVALRFAGSPPAGSTNLSTGNRFLNVGTERSRQQNQLSTETTDLYFAGTLNAGDHEIKAGFDYMQNDIYNSFLQDVNGNYTFACEGAATSTGAVDYSFGRVGGTNAAARVAATCNDLPVNLREQAVIENFQLGRPTAYQVQLALPGRTLDDAIAIWKYNTTGVFVQDSWKFSRKLNLMGGLRVDQMKVPTKPVFNPNASAAPGPADPTTGRATGGFGRSNAETLDGTTLLQPRVGFNWDLGTTEQRMQLRGGVGLFQGAAPNVWLSNPFSNNGMAVGTFSCGSLASCQTAGVVFNANPSTQPGNAAAGIPNVDFVSSELEQPSVWKANIAFESELPPVPLLGRLVASAEYMHTRTNSAMYYKHLNLGAPTRTGRDGRPLFWATSGYNTACWSDVGSALTPAGCASATARIRGLANPAFNNVYLAEKTEEGYGDTVTLSIGRPSQQGFGWSLAYTATRAKEVSPITSSTSGSNWGNRQIFDPNEEVLQNSNYLIKDRVNVALTWSRALWGNNRTSFGMFYEGRKGRPYSWTYINDMNGDGQGGNDLMYIPSAPGSGEVVFRGGAAEEARFWNVVNSNDSLTRARGGVVDRNSTYAPWVNNIDVRFSQEFPGFMKEHKATFTIDILNFTNLLNKKWGRIEEIGFPSNRSFVNYVGMDSQNRYIYSLGTTEAATVRNAANESQWQVQFTLRYTF